MQKNTLIYTFELKKQVVELYLEGYSAMELKERFGLRDRRRVSEWAKKVRDAGTMDVLKDTRGLANKGITRKKKESMVEENERLKLENLYLKKLIELKRR